MYPTLSNSRADRSCFDLRDFRISSLFSIHSSKLPSSCAELSNNRVDISLLRCHLGIQNALGKGIIFILGWYVDAGSKCQSSRAARALLLSCIPFPAPSAKVGIRSPGIRTFPSSQNGWSTKAITLRVNSRDHDLTGMASPILVKDGNQRPRKGQPDHGGDASIGVEGRSGGGVSMCKAELDSAASQGMSLGVMKPRNATLPLPAACLIRRSWCKDSGRRSDLEPTGLHMRLPLLSLVHMMCEPRPWCPFLVTCISVLVLLFLVPVLTVFIGNDGPEGQEQ
jgi:hypothetical protein